MGGRLAIGLTLALWSVIPLVDKIGLVGKKAPLAGLSARLVVAAIVLLPALALSPGGRAELLSLGPREWLAFGASGVISLLLAQYCYYQALQDHDVSRLFPFLFGTAPVLTMVLAWGILGEPVTGRAWVGGGLICLGSLLLFW